MSDRILWLDDDPMEIDACVETLKGRGFEVTIARRVSEADRFLNEQSFVLLIIDVMIPTYPEEEAVYPPSATELGYSTGLAFYKRAKAKLGDQMPKQIALSIRLDTEIKMQFYAAGLPDNCFLRKRDYITNVDVFVRKILEVLGTNSQPSKPNE